MALFLEIDGRQTKYCSPGGWASVLKWLRRSSPAWDPHGWGSSRQWCSAPRIWDTSSTPCQFWWWPAGHTPQKRCWFGVGEQDPTDNNQVCWGVLEFCSRPNSWILVRICTNKESHTGHGTCTPLHWPQTDQKDSLKASKKVAKEDLKITGKFRTTSLAKSWLDLAF